MRYPDHFLLALTVSIFFGIFVAPFYNSLFIFIIILFFYEVIFFLCFPIEYRAFLKAALLSAGIFGFVLGSTFLQKLPVTANEIPKFQELCYNYGIC